MVSVRYLLNQSMDFDQTHIDTVLGKGKEFIRFWWTRPNFQGYTGTLKCPKLGFPALYFEPVGAFDQTCIDALLEEWEELIIF